MPSPAVSRSQPRKPAVKALGASYAFIPVKKNGSFGTAHEWVAMTNNVNKTPTTGDTVIDDSVMGIYPTGGGSLRRHTYRP